MQKQNADQVKECDNHTSKVSTIALKLLSSTGLKKFLNHLKMLHKLA